jgi:uncharacterized protein (TIGR02466 family)
MIIENWFPTPIFYSDAPKSLKETIRSEYDNAEQQIILKTENGTWNDNVSTTFDTITDVLNEANLPTLKSYIFSMVEEFDKCLFPNNQQKIVFGNSWINYCKKYQYQDKHDHLNFSISGIYYLKTNGKDGNLRISAPNQLIARQQSDVEYEPKEGRIILFPSWVLHSVRANMTDSTRVSLAFNFLKPGEI